MELSGVSRGALAFVVGNLGLLTKVSLLPFGGIVVLGVLSSYSPIDATMDLFVRIAFLLTHTRLSWHEFASGILSAGLWMWLVTRVIRLRLGGSSSGLFGSGDALRNAGWMFVYGVSLAVLVFVPGAAVTKIMETLLEEFVPHVWRVQVGGIFGTMILVLCGWVFCRLLIGYQPVAMGHRPGVFAGWQLTESCGWSLFLRVLAPALVLLVLFAATFYVGTLVAFRYSNLFHDLDPADKGRTVMVSVPSRAVIRHLIFLTMAMPILWYVITLFADGNHRLSAKS